MRMNSQDFYLKPIVCKIKIINCFPVNQIISKLIKTECGRSKYLELSKKNGPLATMRLSWFVFWATIKHWDLDSPD